MDNMGLTTFKGAKVRNADVTIAKNYLNKEEIEGLNCIVVMYLDYAEDQAKQHVPMHISDWEEKLNSFLRFTSREVLNNAGSISKEIADSLAKEQYNLFEENRRKAKNNNVLLALPEIHYFVLWQKV